MNFLKRIFISIKRNIWKSTILFLMLFLLSSLMASAILVRNAVLTTDKNLRTQLPAVATIAESHSRQINPQTIHEVGELPYVRTFDYSFVSRFYSSGLEMVILEGSDDILGASHLPVDGLEDFWVKGVHHAGIVDIEEGLIELVSGRTFTEEEIKQGNVAIISEDLMIKNQLNLGDVITLESIVFDWEAAELTYLETFELMEAYIFAYKPFEVEIVGVFSVNSDILTENADHLGVDQMELLINQIYVPNVVTEAGFKFYFYSHRELGFFDWYSEGESADRIWKQPIFALYDARDLGVFSIAANEILPSGLSILDLSVSYQEVISSMEMMEVLANQILWGTSVAVLLVTSLLIMLFFLDRKHEIGVYLALGEKRIKIVTQMVLEVAIVALFSMILSLFAGQIFSDMISRTLLENDILNTNDPIDEWFAFPTQLESFYGGQMTADEFLKQYDVSITLESIVWFSGVGSIVVLLATAIPITYIVKLDPKKVLM